MLELFRKDMQVYVKVLMNLRIPIKYQNKVFDKGEKNELLLPDEVNDILTRNGNIRLWNGEKYVKLNLGQFYDIMQRKEYTIVDYVEPKVEVKPEVKKEEPKVEVKPEVKKEEPKVEVKQPEVKKEENKNIQKNNNNKQRHNNNNNNNKQQGGDK